MSREQELRDQIAHLEREIETRKAALYEADKELAALLSPFQIGDVVTFDRGRYRGRGRVIWISPTRKILSSERTMPDRWVVRRIKKDGSEGDTQEVRHYDHPELEGKP